MDVRDEEFVSPLVVIVSPLWKHGFFNVLAPKMGNLLYQCPLKRCKKVAFILPTEIMNARILRGECDFVATFSDEFLEELDGERDEYSGDEELHAEVQAMRVCCHVVGLLFEPSFSRICDMAPKTKKDVIEFVSSKPEYPYDAVIDVVHQMSTAADELGEVQRTITAVLHR